MTKPTAMTYCNTKTTTLPNAMRHSVAMQKYAEAVSIYSDSNAPLCEIAKQCGVTPRGLSNYICRHHRDILLRKYGIETLNCSESIKKRVGQSIHTHKKYRSAILACSDMAYIECNISQIAAVFALDATALASQLRFHYPEVLPERERVRRELGFSDNIHRGARQCCVEAYAEAVAMYSETDMTVREAAEACNVSMSGLSQHLQFYNKSVVGRKAARRAACSCNTGIERSGTLSGNGRMYGPRPESVEKYAKALELYRTSSMTLKEIATAAGVPYSGFRSYLRLWHNDECRRRCDLSAGKYADAIRSLEENPRHIAKVAAEFGVNPDTFREYLARHVPELAARQGMERRPDGKLVKRSSAEKYAKAIEEYASSADTLKEIADRHGLVYNSLSGYVRRNCRAQQEMHRRIAEGAPS